MRAIAKMESQQPDPPLMQYNYQHVFNKARGLSLRPKHSQSQSITTLPKLNKKFNLIPGSNEGGGIPMYGKMKNPIRGVTERNIMPTHYLERLRHKVDSYLGKTKNGIEVVMRDPMDVQVTTMLRRLHSIPIPTEESSVGIATILAIRVHAQPCLTVCCRALPDPPPLH